MTQSEFSQLRDRWYEKLKKKGFDDIENKHGELKKESRAFKAIQDQEAYKTYFEIALEFLRSNQFKTKRERAIWQRHCEGQTIRFIALKMKLTRNQVFFAVKRLKKEAKIAGSEG